MYLRPSCTNWWARHTRLSLLMWLNCTRSRNPNIRLVKSVHQSQYWCDYWRKKSYLSSNPRSEKPASSAWTNSPCFNIFRIAPHKITEWSFMRDFAIPVNQSYLEDTIRSEVSEWDFNQSLIKKRHFLTWSIVRTSGERPPWTHRT